MPTIICTVTNDLIYDQRMQRICSTLADRGYRVILVGRALPHSLPLETRNFEQHRLRCRFNRGMLFYAEFNLRLWWYLMWANYDAICSVDLDTVAAGCLAGLFRRKKRVFDAHEYFTEVPEVTGRPVVKFVWSAVARLCLPFYQLAYTVGPALAAIFEKKYHIPFGVVRNVSKTPDAHIEIKQAAQKVLLYQGALNVGRGIEQTLRAMQHLDGPELWLAGEGDLSETLRNMASELGVQGKVRFLGRVRPEALKQLTPQAWLGLNVLENKGLSYYYSLANKFFDYVHAGVPQITMNFPEYQALNAQYEVAVMLDVLSPETIVSAVRQLLDDPETYARLQRETQIARQAWNWEKESAVLLQLWDQAFPGED